MAPFRSKTGIKIHPSFWVAHLSCHISLRKFSILTNVFFPFCAVATFVIIHKRI
jgi:hypothetical protein